MPRPAIVSLIGFPGAGKLTIANQVAARAAEPFVVVDNHHVNNVVFKVIDTNGIKPLPTRVWSFVSQVRDGVLGAIEELGPPDWSYVFTNVIVADDDKDREVLDGLADLARKRRSAFVPVRLHCEIDELSRRIVSQDRRERLKWLDPEGVRQLATARRLIDVAFPHALDLDVTTIPAAKAAEAVLGHIESIPMIEEPR